jgi:hypothetical protein
MIWTEEHLRCRVGLFGAPLPADRLRVIRRRWHQPPLKWGGVIQKRQYWSCSVVQRWGRNETMWHFPVQGDCTPLQAIRALMPEPEHQQSRRVG